MRCASALVPALLAALLGIATGPAGSAEDAGTNPAPTAQDWARLAAAPDWSGVWTPTSGLPMPDDPKFALPWTPSAASQIAAMRAAENAGHPDNIYINCLPEGMPSFIMMTLNALEILSTPGRLTILSEFDGNRLRRIYTDGRPHPADPDLTFNGHSIGHWEGDKLVVDTVGILPEAYIALGQAVGIPNNGDMHLVEHIHLTAPDILTDELDITAPHVLTASWRTSRSFARHRDRRSDIVEASCRQGDFVERKDRNNNAVFAPLAHDEGGAPLPGQ